MTSHEENDGTRNERTVSGFFAICEKKKRVPMDCAGRDPYLSFSREYFKLQCLPLYKRRFNAPWSH